MNWWMLTAITCHICCRLIRLCTGRIHPAGQPDVIPGRPSREHPAHTPALSQSSPMYMARSVSAMRVMDTPRHGICQRQGTFLKAMPREVPGMTISGGKLPRDMELHGDQDLPLSNIQTITGPR